MKRNTYYDCPHCRGSGLVKMPESVILDVMRVVQLAAHHGKVKRLTVSVAPEVAFQVLNTKRATISKFESETGTLITIHGDANLTSDQIECTCEDIRGQQVVLNTPYTN